MKIRAILFLPLLLACTRDPAETPFPPRDAPRTVIAPQIASHPTADHTCVVDGYGAVSCWGRNDARQLGDANPSATRARVAIDGRFVMVAVGARHTCALSDEGIAYCWGANRSGQRGTADTTSLAEPTHVDTERRFARMTAGAAHTCALDREGRAFCWGDNSWGQLGNGTRAPSTTPIAVRTDTIFARLSAGGRHTCGVTAGNALLCWGDNFLGQLGLPRATQTSSAPVAVPIATTVAAVSAGHGHACALAADGAGWCWGQNGIGQLGSGAPPGASAPVRVEGAPPLAELRVGYHHTCAIDVEGGAWCWGANTSSEPGDASVTGQLASDVSWSNLPMRVELDAPLAALAPGDGHTCALTRASVIYCFGSNRFGQLGVAGPPRSQEPMRVMRVELDPTTTRP